MSLRLSSCNVSPLNPEPYTLNHQLEFVRLRSAVPTGRESGFGFAEDAFGV